MRGWAVLLLVGACLPVAADDVRVLARDLAAASPGVVASEPQYGGLVVCHGEGGSEEWIVSVAAGGNYYLHAWYASGDARPVRLSLNGAPCEGTFLARVTGGYLPEHLDWDTYGPFTLTEGDNTLRVTAIGYMPHIAGWVISTSPDQWDREAFAEEFPDPSEVARREVARLSERMARARAALRRRTGLEEILFIKRITYTSDHYYTEYINSRWTPGGGVYVLSLRDGTVRPLTTDLPGGVFGRLDLSWDARRVLFDWKAAEDAGYRIYEVGIDGTRPRQVLAPPEDEAATVERYHQRYHNGSDDMHPCYLPDGGVVFVSTRCRTSTLCDGSDSFTTTVLYRVEADGTGLRQLSYGALSEATPSVLPDGRLMYTRWEYVDKGAVGAKGLWAIRPDGSGSSEVYGNDVPFPPTMIQGRAIPGEPNGYVALGCPHYPQNALGTIIAVNTSHPLRTDEPMTYLTPDVKVLAEWGWDFADADPAGTTVQDGSGQGPLFRDPYPLGNGGFLVAHKPRGFGTAYTPNGYGLYALLPDGALEPLYHDPEISSWQPVPLRPRSVPPVIAGALDPALAARGLARCLVADVYRGMEGVERGTIRHLRILEQMPRPWSARRFGDVFVDEYDQQHAVVSKDTALGLKVLHGVVPVDEDGSAHFLVPARSNVFLQALDADYLAVQTERTFVNYAPGESRSCVGCHETNTDAAPSVARAVPLALTREPSEPAPQPGDVTAHRPLHYPTDVQPVLDRHCLECHRADRKEGGLDLSGTETRLFSVSYESLLSERRGARTDRVEPDLVPTIGENHPKTGNVRYLPARSLGSHNSVLMAMLMPNAIRLEGDAARLARVARLVEAHRTIRLPLEDLVRLSTWVDTNAQYYGSYFGRRNLAERDHSDFRPTPTWESATAR